MIFKVEYVDCDYNLFPEGFVDKIVHDANTTTFYILKSKNKSIKDKALNDFAQHIKDFLVSPVDVYEGQTTHKVPLNVNILGGLFTYDGNQYNVNLTSGKWGDALIPSIMWYDDNMHYIKLINTRYFLNILE